MSSPDRPDGVLRLVYGDTPPSYNATRYMHWRESKGHFETWLGIYEQLLAQAKMPRAERVRVRAILSFAAAGRRDADNYLTPVSKPLGDALTGRRHKIGPKQLVWPDGRWIRDDTPEHYRFGTVTFERDRSLGFRMELDKKAGKMRRRWNSRTTIVLAYWL